MIVINAAMARQLNDFATAVEEMISQGMNRDEAVFKELKRIIKESKGVCFEGDGYSKQWEEESKRRKLTNINSVPEALLKYEDAAAKDVLLGERIFTPAELSSRVDVEMEKYVKKIQIESRVLGDLTINHVIPAAVAYENILLDNVVKMKSVFSETEYERLTCKRRDLIVEIQERIDALKELVHEMTEARKYCNNLHSVRAKALAYSERVDCYLDKIREHIDTLEMNIDNEIWPLPKYRELLFTR